MFFEVVQARPNPSLRYRTASFSTHLLESRSSWRARILFLFYLNHLLRNLWFFLVFLERGHGTTVVLQNEITNFRHALAVFDGSKEYGTHRRGVLTSNTTTTPTAIVIMVVVMWWSVVVVGVVVVGGGPHAECIAAHDFEIGPDRVGEIDFIDNEQIGLRNTGSAFARDLVPAGHVNHVEREVGQFARKIGRQIVSPRFAQQ